MFSCLKSHMRLALALMSLLNYRRFDLAPPDDPRISSYGARFARSDRGRGSDGVVQGRKLRMRIKGVAAVAQALPSSGVITSQ